MNRLPLPASARAEAGAALDALACGTSPGRDALAAAVLVLEWEATAHGDREVMTAADLVRDLMNCDRISLNDADRRGAAALADLVRRCCPTTPT